MLVALYRLHCCLRRAQMLLLFLGIAYLMAGSILLLQRSSSLRVAQQQQQQQQQPSPGGGATNNLLLFPPPPLLSLAAPPTALRMAGLGVGARSRWADNTQPLSGAGVKVGVGPSPRWPRGAASSRSNMGGVQHLHRRWFHSPVPENPEQRVALRRSGRHKGTYIGCFLHDANERALGGTVLYDLRKMTSSLCQDTCSESGYRFAGLEYGAECHCGNRISSPRVPEEDCSLVCRGERRGSLCGGVGRLSIYKVEEQPPGHRKFRNVHYSGCFRMPQSAVRSFPVYSIQPNLTTQSCIETCTDKELPLAVLMKPHCFCTRTSSLFNPSLQRQEQPCVGSSTALNRTNTGGSTTLNHTNTGGRSTLNRTDTGGSTALNRTDTGGLNHTNTGSLNHTNTGSLNHINTGSLNHINTSTSTQPSTSDEEYQVYEVYHTPMLDSRCKERMFLPQRASSLVALSSFPGAGNTWVRHLIELVTGYYTGSFYFDGTLYNRGFKGEKDYWRSGRSVCVKTHESGQKEIEMFDSAILLIRNPYRSLAAEFNRKCAGHLGHATEAQWKSKDWPEFVDSYAPWWASHALSWLKFGRRLLVVHYEELQRALFPQLRLVTSFLNATLTEDRLLCAQSNQEGHFKRSAAQQPSSFDPFTPSMRRTIDSFIRSVDQALQKRNFSGLPEDYLPR